MSSTHACNFALLIFDALSSFFLFEQSFDQFLFVQIVEVLSSLKVFYLIFLLKQRDLLLLVNFFLISFLELLYQIVPFRLSFNQMLETFLVFLFYTFEFFMNGPLFFYPFLLLLLNFSFYLSSSMLFTGLKSFESIKGWLQVKMVLNLLNFFLSFLYFYIMIFCCILYFFHVFKKLILTGLHFLFKFL